MLFVGRVESRLNSMRELGKILLLFGKTQTLLGLLETVKQYGR
jgi:hypothetical protein